MVPDDLRTALEDSMQAFFGAQEGDAAQGADASAAVPAAAASAASKPKKDAAPVLALSQHFSNGTKISTEIADVILQLYERDGRKHSFETDLTIRNFADEDACAHFISRMLMASYRRHDIGSLFKVENKISRDVIRGGWTDLRIMLEQSKGHVVVPVIRLPREVAIKAGFALIDSLLEEKGEPAERAHNFVSACALFREMEDTLRRGNFNHDPQIVAQFTEQAARLNAKFNALADNLCQQDDIDALGTLLEGLHQERGRIVPAPAHPHPISDRGFKEALDKYYCGQIFKKALGQSFDEFMTSWREPAVSDRAALRAFLSKHISAAHRELSPKFSAFADFHRFQTVADLERSLSLDMAYNELILFVTSDAFLQRGETRRDLLKLNAELTKHSYPGLVNFDEDAIDDPEKIFLTPADDYRPERDAARQRLTRAVEKCKRRLGEEDWSWGKDGLEQLSNMASKVSLLSGLSESVMGEGEDPWRLAFSNKQMSFGTELDEILKPWALALLRDQKDTESLVSDIESDSVRTCDQLARHIREGFLDRQPKGGLRSMFVPVAVSQLGTIANLLDQFQDVPLSAQKHPALAAAGSADVGVDTADSTATSAAEKSDVPTDAELDAFREGLKRAVGAQEESVADTSSGKDEEAPAVLGSDAASGVSAGMYPLLGRSDVTPVAAKDVGDAYPDLSRVVSTGALSFGPGGLPSFELPRAEDSREAKKDGDSPPPVNPAWLAAQSDEAAGEAPGQGDDEVPARAPKRVQDPDNNNYIPEAEEVDVPAFDVVVPDGSSAASVTGRPGSPLLFDPASVVPSAPPADPVDADALLAGAPSAPKGALTPTPASAELQLA
jgi:hypothetical protein